MRRRVTRIVGDSQNEVRRSRSWLIDIGFVVLVIGAAVLYAKWRTHRVERWIVDSETRLHSDARFGAVSLFRRGYEYRTTRAMSTLTSISAQGWVCDDTDLVELRRLLTEWNPPDTLSISVVSCDGDRPGFELISRVARETGLFSPVVPNGDSGGTRK